MKLNRRHFLRATGVSLALPWLAGLAQAKLGPASEEERLRVGVRMMVVDIERVARLRQREGGSVLGRRDHLVARFEHAREDRKDPDDELGQRTHALAPAAQLDPTDAAVFLSFLFFRSTI